MPRTWAATILLSLSAFAQSTLPLKLVEGWPRLPAGWNFGEMAGVAVDARDNVWIFHRGPHPVMQFDPQGNLLRWWDGVAVDSAHGIEVDPDGNVWLVDVRAHRITKHTPEGRVLMVFGDVGGRAGNNDTPYAYDRPTAVAFRAGGGFYLSDGYGNSRVVEYAKNGDLVRQWGKKGSAPGEFNLVHDVLTTPDGKVYVADRDNDRVQVFDAAGKFLAQWTGHGSAWGLAHLKSEDAIYMSDGKNNRIAKLNRDGKLLGLYGSFGKAPGRFDFPHHIAVDSKGALYVAEIKNWRVQKFVPAP
jgi:DNA-binding beta-propeller fold protein YncE